MSGRSNTQSQRPHGLTNKAPPKKTLKALRTMRPDDPGEREREAQETAATGPDEPQQQHLFIKEFRPGNQITQFFQLRSVEARKTKQGADFLSLELRDRSGNIPGRMWSEAIRRWGKEFNPGDFVKVAGRIETYKDYNQFIVEKMYRVEESQIPDIEDVVYAGPKNLQEMFDQLVSWARDLKPPDLGEVVVDVLTGHQDAVKRCPAAKMIHHAYPGGLVEHTVSLTKKVMAVLDLEPAIEPGIAIAGAILHDIGKVKELDASGQRRTPEGRLVGHVILGVEMVREAAAARNALDRPWVRELEHVLLSHHGEPQFGAPVRPYSREAILVHFMDNLDSRLKIIDEALESADPEGFSAYNKWLEGRAFAGTGGRSEEEENAGT